MSNSYVAEHAAADAPEDMPLVWPILTPAELAQAELAQAERPPDRSVKLEHLLAYLAGALALAAMIVPTILKLAAIRRPRRHHRQRRTGTVSIPAFVPTRMLPRSVQTAARETDIVKKLSAAAQRADIARAPPTPRAASHDIEERLRRLLHDWQRAAA